MKGVQCYELFGGIALKIHTFSFFSFFIKLLFIYIYIYYTLVLVCFTEERIG